MTFGETFSSGLDLPTNHDQISSLKRPESPNSDLKDIKGQMWDAQGVGDANMTEDERYWGELRYRKRCIRATGGILNDIEKRKVVREGKRLGEEILQTRRAKFGKISGKKLSALETKILKMHTEMREELAEVGQNVDRENLRRRGKKLGRLGEGKEEGKMKGDAEEHWERMILCVGQISRRLSGMSGGMLADSTLDEQRKWVGSWKPDDGRDVGRGAWDFWHDLGGVGVGVVRKDVMGEGLHVRDALCNEDSSQVFNVEPDKKIVAIEDKNTSDNGIAKFKFMFGKQEDSKPRSSEMQEEGRARQKKKNIVTEDLNPEMTLVGRRDARARPVVRKDVAGAADAQSDRE